MRNQSRQKEQETDARVGIAIKMRRVSLGITQSKLGSVLGVTFQQIQKIETGKNRVGAGRLYMISKALDVDVSYFFSGCDSREKLDREYNADTDNKIEFRADKEELLEIFIKLYSMKDEGIKKNLLQIIRALP